ncbi:pyridoxamine 5'-phosphate oxidase family protein [Candidatus Dojkabacteria bacterium]|nr:pyridoxamine 5'-phosphate oxidase family protein [Candidatus Dojkabacteria bacterium]
MNTKEKALKILEENLYMTLSTVDPEGNPWISNAYFAYDKDMNIYWYSPRKSQHSTYIRNNPNIAISIFNSTLTGEDVDAIYIKAKAKELTNPLEIARGLKILGKKLLKTKFVNGRDEMKKFISSVRDFRLTSPLRMYIAKSTEIFKLAPIMMYKKHYLDSKIKVELEEK